MCLDAGKEEKNSKTGALPGYLLQGLSLSLICSPPPLLFSLYLLSVFFCFCFGFPLDFTHSAPPTSSLFFLFLLPPNSSISLFPSPLSFSFFFFFPLPTPLSRIFSPSPIWLSPFFLVCFFFFLFFILHSPLFLASSLIKYHPLPLRHGEVGV